MYKTTYKRRPAFIEISIMLIINVLYSTYNRNDIIDSPKMWYQLNFNIKCAASQGLSQKFRNSHLTDEYSNQLQRLYLFLLTRISRKHICYWWIFRNGMVQFDYWLLSTKHVWIAFFLTTERLWMNDMHIGRFPKLKWSNRANKMKFICLVWFVLHRIAIGIKFIHGNFEQNMRLYVVAVVSICGLIDCKWCRFDYTIFN